MTATLTQAAPVPGRPGVARRSILLAAHDLLRWAPVSEDTKQRLLREGVRLVGMEELTVQLGSPVSLVDAWMRGLASMPDRKFLQAGRPDRPVRPAGKRLARNQAMCIMLNQTGDLHVAAQGRADRAT